MLDSSSPLRHSLLLTWVLVALASSSLGAGCDGLSRMFSTDDGRELSGRLDLDDAWTEVALDPALGTRHQTQQVGLAVPNAPRWQFNPDGSSLDAPDGTGYTILVDLRSTNGTRYELRAMSVGSALFFSHTGEQHDGRYLDFPPDAEFDRLYLRSTPPLTVEKVRWVDKTSL